MSLCGVVSAVVFLAVWYVNLTEGKKHSIHFLKNKYKTDTRFWDILVNISKVLIKVNCLNNSVQTGRVQRKKAVESFKGTLGYNALYSLKSK